jgi:hypothetical protein
MPDYSKGMIYMLEATIHYEEGDIYYDSTTQPLHKRFYEHKHILNYDKPGKSKKIFQKYGIENIKIIFIQNYPCESKKELKAEEAKYIRNHKCVNRIIPGRCKQEFCEDNKESLKEYRETNKERKQEYDKTYRKENYEAIKVKKNEKIKCVCGCDVNKQNLKQHQQTNKHIDLMKCI